MHTSKEQRFGLEGEVFVKSLLESNGYRVKEISNFFESYDLLLMGHVPILIEVKIARPTRQKTRPGYYRDRWQFHTPRPKDSIDHLIILVVVDRNKKKHVYFVPSWEIAFQNQVQITSHPSKYSGRFAPFLNDWQQIEQVMSQRQKHSLQLPLL